MQTRYSVKLLFRFCPFTALSGAPNPIHARYKYRTKRIAYKIYGPIPTLGTVQYYGSILTTTTNGYYI